MISDGESILRGLRWRPEVKPCATDQELAGM